MVGAPRKVEVERESDSDGDDAPEQITLSSGREEAKKLRKEERDNKKRVQADAKQRRQRHIFQKKNEVSLAEKKEPPAADFSEEAGANPAEDEQDLNFSKSARVSRLLDASIIDFLAAQEKKVVEDSTQKVEKPEKQKRIGKRKGRQAVISSSRVKVVLLEAHRPSLANCQSALDFKRNRLYGDLVHRSLKMLPRPS